MPRLIDADTLKAEFTGNFHEIWHYTGVRAIIDVAPTIDSVPVVHGHWIILRCPSGAKYSVCSECKTYMVDYSERNSMRKINAEGAKYCPNCGARMDGGKKENG